MTADELRYDAIVVGGGLAGMLTALELRPLRVALVANRALGVGTSSAWAQGGIAAAVGHDDSPALHAADTVAAGAGLVERRVAARLAADAPHAIERVASLGVRFDRDASGAYALGREGAHSRRRILRAGGDASGAELVRAVVEAVLGSPSIVVIADAVALDVALASRHVCGLSVRTRHGARAQLHAPAVVLATGGLGGLYQYTTNPKASRGSGIAIAARAGARLADLEFVQFHPTALDVASDPLPLVTEALRGEGAVLVDGAGARIMSGVAGEDLASRDVVARHVFAARRAGRRTYLDARNAAGSAFPARFPTVFAACRAYGIDPRTQPIPIVPAAHYHMGGVDVDLEGRTNVPGLYACGEVASTGVHGANRLASNSLLESVVYPERIATAIRSSDRGRSSRASVVAAVRADVPGPSGEARPADWNALRTTMYALVGVERERAGLEVAVERLTHLAAATADAELRDAALVGSLVARAALNRHETRGSHARLDYPRLVAGERHRSYASFDDLRLPAASA